MSEWNHSICDECWTRQRGEQIPCRLKEPYRESERCCFCGLMHRSGIYIRCHPSDMLCNGEHEAFKNAR